MNSSTDIYNMLVGKKISVPDYQRAYSWDTSGNSAQPRQVDVFFSDLTNYINSSSTSNYYFGQFLFEDMGENKLAVIDGQQRLTTIEIFLAVLFKKLKLLNAMSPRDEDNYFAVVKRSSGYVFSTVDYDDQYFRDYVIDDKNPISTDTLSKKRIKDAYDFLWAKIDKLDEAHVRQYLDSVLKATCSTHMVK
ncbi:MAG: DUF262 domain-containing protein, partial [Desulfovibrio sp.]|nr:DUF262 domain-containing protein [Desulfovibrio sp.]